MELKKIMKTIVKNNEINTKNENVINHTNFTNDISINTSLYLSSDKWFKGSRSRGIRNILKS